MKKYSLILMVALVSGIMPVFSQLYHGNSGYDRKLDTLNSQVGVDSRNINRFKIPYFKTTHIVSPEPILYVDISSPNVQGDLPEKNVFRLKPNSNAESGHIIGIDENFTVTIITKTFITVYTLSFNQNDLDIGNIQNTAFLLTVDPSKGIQLNNYSKIQREDYDRLSVLAMSNKRKIFNVHSKDKGMELWLNNVYVIGDLVLFDIGAQNHTNLQYDISSVDFKLMDKYTVNATVSHEIEMKALYSFTEDATTIIEGKWRNFYILKKFTYPSQKTLSIQINENQISGRPVKINVNYNQVLESKKLLN